jgi:hypothetical protein
MEEKKLTLEDFYPSEDTITLHLTMEWLLKSQKGETKKSMKKFVSDLEERKRMAIKIAAFQILKVAIKVGKTKPDEINAQQILNKIQLN